MLRENIPRATLKGRWDSRVPPVGRWAQHFTKRIESEFTVPLCIYQENITLMDSMIHETIIRILTQKTQAFINQDM